MKNGFPPEIAVIRAVLEPVECAIPAAIGTNATTVPTLVPIEIDMKRHG